MNFLPAQNHGCSQLCFLQLPQRSQALFLRTPIIKCRGLYFGPKTIFIPPPPSENYISSPSRNTSFFDSHRGLFALILPYFAFILPFYFPFSNFLFPFFLFLQHFPPFSLGLFPQMTSADIFPPLGGGGYFPIYRPLIKC